MFNHITLIFICLYLEAYNLKLTFNNLSNGRNANYVYISSMADCIFPRQLHQYMSHLTYSSCNGISTLDQDPFLFLCPLSLTQSLSLYAVNKPILAHMGDYIHSSTWRKMEFRYWYLVTTASYKPPDDSSPKPWVSQLRPQAL